MTKILSAVNAVASGPAVWYRASVIWPADTVFASLRENGVTVHFIKSMITKPCNGTEHMCVGWDAAMTVVRSTLNSHVLSSEMTASGRHSGRHNLCQVFPVTIKKRTAFCPTAYRIISITRHTPQEWNFRVEVDFQPAGDSLSSLPAMRWGGAHFYF